MNRLAARRAGFSRAATAFVSQPEPRSIGLIARGRQLVVGNVLFAGHLIEIGPKGMIWDINPPSLGFEDVLHGFAWMDDLAALGDAAARERAQAWFYEWLRRYGRGKGPGWAPELAGRRLIRLINHAFLLLSSRSKTDQDKFFRTLAAQTTYLSKRWRQSIPGLPRFEALTGLIYAGLSLEGMDGHVAAAVQGLCDVCQDQIDDQGGLPTRNPEELLEVFTLLTWASQALEETENEIPPVLAETIARIAPTLRALRHSDGGLARFHGGGRGIEGRLDLALATSGVRATAPQGLAMGYARLSSGRTTLIVDAAAPPTGPASFAAHASTNAFELTSGRDPIIVSCGSGEAFGESWRLAGRATPSHSTLAIEGFSSSRFGNDGRGQRDMLNDVPDDVPLQKTRAIDGSRLQVGHSGYRWTHGLMHARTIDLTLDGKGVAGEDVLTPLTDADIQQFEKMRLSEDGKIDFAIRFHLHPDVEPNVDMGGAAVSLTTASGDIWIFRHDGLAALVVEPSVYLEKGRLKPRPCQQIVLKHAATESLTKLRWSLAKARENPLSGGRNTGIARGLPAPD